jgi:hypothetical protein
MALVFRVINLSFVVLLFCFGRLKLPTIDSPARQVPQTNDLNRLFVIISILESSGTSIAGDFNRPKKAIPRNLG